MTGQDGGPAATIAEVIFGLALWSMIFFAAGIAVGARWS